MLSHPNETVSREALALMKALLFSGNMEVQKGIAEDVKSTKEETMFISLKKRLDIASIHYTEMYVQHTLHYMFNTFDVIHMKSCI